jgi:hypothetical protein
VGTARRREDLAGEPHEVGAVRGIKIPHFLRGFYLNHKSPPSIPRIISPFAGY